MSDTKFDLSRAPPPAYSDALLIRPENNMIRLDFLYVQREAGIAVGVGQPILMGEAQLREVLSAIERHLSSRQQVIIAKGNDTPQ